MYELFTIIIIITMGSYIHGQYFDLEMTSILCLLIASDLTWIERQTFFLCTLKTHFILRFQFI